MFCKRKIEFEIIKHWQKNLHLNIGIKGTFSIERLKKMFNAISIKKPYIKNLKQKIIK